MKYKKFIIHKYKAVNEAIISLRNNLIPIIGINESGKTSILQGIVAFDKSCDNLQGGHHLNAKNRYESGSQGHYVSAEIEIENVEEKNDILKISGAKKGSSTYKKIKSFLEDIEIIKITRNIDNKSYTIEGLEISSNLDKIIEYFFDNTPFLIYYDDFTDRVPETIEFPDSYFYEEPIKELKETETTEGIKEKFRPNEWHDIINEIFYRATEKKVNLNDFIDNNDEDERKGILSDVSDKLNSDIIKDWQKLKVLKKSLKVEILDLTLALNYNLQDTNHIFSFGVIDKKHKGKSRFFSINERSKGFQWFFNFAIKLKYNTKYNEEFEDAIYILDEPGSYLHSSAQEELLNSIKEISKTNKVIFCTHSHYLLNPDSINVNSIKIAVRKDSSILLQNFNEYEETNKTQGALTPLFHSLQLNIGSSLKIKENNIIITEGVIDYYFFKMANKFIDFFQQIKIEVIPGSSAGNLKELISYSIAWSNNYIVLLDSDKAGKTAFDIYNKYFGDEEAKRWIKYSLPKKADKVKLESFISTNDQKRLIKLTSNNNIKRAIISLYFLSIEEQKSFFINLNKTTTSNLQHISDIIIRKFK